MSRIKLNDQDPSLKDRIAEQRGGEGIRVCFSCKACTAACPITAVNEKYDPRKIIRMALLGMKKELLESEFIWFCSSCYGCHEVCPQNVSFTEVMFAIKNVAAQEACIPASLGAQRSLLKTHGRMYQIGEFENEKREKLGLPAITEYPEDYDALL